MEQIETYLDSSILSKYKEEYKIDKRDRETSAYGRLIYFTTLERVFDNLTDDARLVIINSELERYQREASKVKEEEKERLKKLNELTEEEKNKVAYIEISENFDYNNATPEEKRKNIRVFSHYELAKRFIEESYMYDEEISFLKTYLEQILKKQKVTLQ